MATLLAAAGAIGACKANSGGAEAGAAGSGVAAASVSAAPAGSVVTLSGGIPLPADAIAHVLNPDGRAEYKGPTGAVEGVVRVKGSPPPDRPGRRPPLGCGEAHGMYEKLFRVGKGGALADAIVGVTDYDGFVPAREEATLVAIRGCAFDRRTIAMTYGQRVEVQNTDEREAYVPHLDGARMPALMVAIPRGDVVRMYPPRPGHYMLQDDMKHSWMEAEVFVFKFPTHDVTKADGSFRVEGVPVGKVKVSARHPVIDQTIDKQVEIKAGETAHVECEITYQPPAPAAEPARSAEPIIK
jgi:hypothetical protein